MAAVTDDNMDDSFDNISINWDAFSHLGSDSEYQTAAGLSDNDSDKDSDSEPPPPFPIPSTDDSIDDLHPQQNTVNSKEETSPSLSRHSTTSPLSECITNHRSNGQQEGHHVVTTKTPKPNPITFKDCITSQKINDWDHDQIARVNAKYNHFFVETLKSPKYIMAPMVGGSELPFRMMARKYGCNLCYSPMVSAQAIVEVFEKSGNLDDRLRFHPDDRPLIIQLCANDADDIVKAVKIIQGLGDICDGIDINLGCPKHCAQKTRYGAFLLDEPKTVRSMITALCKQCSLPITAKIRILESLQETLAFTDMLVESGISMLAVHGRRREKRFWHEPANLVMIRQIKRHYKNHYGLDLPVISNGNIMKLQDADNNLKFTGCDAVMSAYGLLRNPFLFDPEQTSLEWTVERGIATSWEYLDFVEKYGVFSGNPVRYHLDKFNDTFFREKDNDSEREKANKQKLYGLLRGEWSYQSQDTATEWAACIEIIEMMMGKKLTFERSSRGNRGMNGNRRKKQCVVESLLANFALSAQVEILNIERMHGKKGDYIQVTARLNLMSDGVTEQIQTSRGVKTVRIGKARSVDFGSVSIKWTVPAE